MPEYEIPPTVTYPLGGGLNQGLPPTSIKPSEHPILENFYPFGQKLIRRGGIRQVTSSAFTEALTSFFPFKDSTGNWTLLVSGQTRFGKMSGMGFLLIPNAKGVSIASVNLPFTWFQYNDVAYAVRPGGGALYRITPGTVMKSGIPAAETAPVLTQGGAGALASGDYSAVVTGANSNTGAESNPSPESNVLSLASLKDIDWSTIPTFTSPQVNTRRIYRTLVDQVNEYFYVATLPNNVDTTYTGDEVLPQDQGDPVSFENFEPTSGLTWVAVWNERAFATNGTDLFYSNLFNMEGWTGRSIPVFKDDGHEIRVLYAFGDRLIIGKTNKVHFLIGADRSTFRLLTLSDKHGCVAGHSMKAAENILFWYGSGRNFYRSDGNSVAGIADIKIKTILEAIPDSAQEQIVAATFPTLSWYVATIPQAVGNNAIVVVYNYRSNAWTVFRHPGDAPQFLAEFFDADYGRALYGTQYDGQLYHLYDSSKTDDFGTAIAAKLLTKEEDGGTYMAKALRRVHLLCSTAAEQITLKAYRDGRSAPSASRSASLADDQAWKSINLSTMRDRGGTIQLGLEYSGATPIEIEAIGLDVEIVERAVGQPQ